MTIATISARDVAVGDGLSLHVSESGDTSARPVVWLHGSGPGATALSNWERLITQFLPRFHNIAPDMLGFGDSSHPEEPPQGLVAFTELRARTTIGLLDALGLDKVDIVGNSMGGMVALRLLLDAPERFDRVVLMGTGGAPIPPGPELMEMIMFYEDPTPARMRQLMNNFLYDPEGFTGDLDHIAETRTAKAVQPEVERSFRATFNFQAGGRLQYTADELKTLPHQTLLLHGREDRMVPLAASYYFLEHLDNAQLHVVPHTGHWMQIEQPERFAAQIESFLTEGR